MPIEKKSPENKSNKENSTIVKCKAEDSKTKQQLNSQNSPTTVKKNNQSQTLSDNAAFGTKPRVAHTSKNRESSVVKIG